MQYRNLGRSNIRVSELAFGCGMLLNASRHFEHGKTLIKHALDKGVNFFDTAESYAQGQADVLLGESLRGHKRENFIISTKLFGTGDKPSEHGLSKDHLIEGTKKSLKRLQLDYVDILFCHRIDLQTPLIETVQAMDYLVRHGYILHWGTSQWPAALLEEVFTLCKNFNLIAPSVEQPQYSLLDRDKFENQIVPLCKKHGMGTTVWGALACGVLAGRYKEGVWKGSRLEQVPKLKSKLSTQAIQGVENLSKLAEQLSCSLAELALAWCLSNPFVNSVILGVSSIDQLNSCLSASSFRSKLPADLISGIESCFPLNM